MATERARDRVPEAREPGPWSDAGLRMLSPERLALPDYEYLAQRHVLTYMEDAVCQLLENKEDVSQYGIARFFTEYFHSVCQGTHILFREFSFIQATPHNRASFLRAFWRCFRTVGKNGDLLTMREYHCLLQLLCPDFPLELTQKAARIVLTDDAMDCLMSFSDFLFAFQIQFYYAEFLESVAAIYQDLLSGKNPNTVIVPTSSSGQHRQRPTLGEASTLEGVEASLFCQCLENLCDRHKYSCPPPALVKEVLSNVQRLTFYGFLVALSKHHGINQALGKPELAVASLASPYSVQPGRSWPGVGRNPKAGRLHRVCLDSSGPDPEAQGARWRITPDVPSEASPSGAKHSPPRPSAAPA
ncbi:centriolar satellite-associated tubulin polyglutamylase complex regulator 1 isoform X1 [Hippopotamus amphibius kiboko]|uniref:centriolar satellite-associated tubulin polyglutamylase complex regulator 1 isoform X1 n=1 Tax=Hippopotamus amphibius kiboko TaxID=575201 RepID=UPI00259ACF17|nr:centriolar satellite-associated tubulin polyglutamylase complex regulator 1 isoform X1 [Hippopotamus amphibius kiboko]